ncbi:major facilitator superfamily domain-containing protein [Aspergillus venezuelensis]
MAFSFLRGENQSSDIAEVNPPNNEASKADNAIIEKYPVPNTEPGTKTSFSIYTPFEKKWISFLASFGAMFSTLSSYIYFPALDPIARDLGVSLSLINLSVMTYMFMAGIAPAFMGDLGDQGGRRPAYILMLVLVFGSNIGLALQNSYPALLVLRILQSAGASAYGVVADITTTAERGSYVGSLIFMTNAAPSFGPVIAGILTQELGWRWSFRLLVILTGVYLLMTKFLLPETQRKIVGNGSVRTKGIHRSFFDTLTTDRKTQDHEHDTANKRKCHIPNPFKCISMLYSKSNITVILIGSITYVFKMTLQALLAAQCVEVYDLNYLEPGLIYLPSGTGAAIASYSTGRFLDRNLKKFAARHGKEGQYKRGDNITDFSIEEARFAGIYTLILLSAASTAGYGVSLYKETRIAVPLIM